MTNDQYPQWKEQFLLEMKEEGWGKEQLDWFADEFDKRTKTDRDLLLAGQITENEALNRQQGMFGQ